MTANPVYFKKTLFTAFVAHYYVVCTKCQHRLLRFAVFERLGQFRVAKTAKRAIIIIGAFNSGATS